MSDLRNILGNLGPVKNPVLLTSSTFSIAVMYFNHDLFERPGLIPQVTASAMFILAVAVFCAALAFYIFAFFRLPSTVHEQIFLQEAKTAIERHQTVETRTKLRRPPRDD